MPQKTAVVHGLMSSATDFTVSGFGAVSAAIVVISGSSSTQRLSDGAMLSVGIWDGVRQYCIAGVCSHGVNPSYAQRLMRNNAIAYDLMGGGVAYTIENITDGVRISTAGSSAPLHCTVHLIGGASARSIILFTSDGTFNAFNFPFTPACLVSLTMGSTAFNSLQADYALSMGVATRAGEQRSAYFASSNNTSPNLNVMKYSEDACGTVYSTAGALTNKLSVVDWTSNNISLNASGSLFPRYLCLALSDDVSVRLKTLTTPAAGFNTTLYTEVKADSLLSVFTSAPSTSLVSDNDANAMSVGMASRALGALSYGTGIAIQDGAATSNAQSYHGNSGDTEGAFYLRKAASGSVSDHLVGFPSTWMDADIQNFWFTRPSPSVKGWVLVFGVIPPAEGTGTTGLEFDTTGVGYRQSAASGDTILAFDQNGAGYIDSIGLGSIGLTLDAVAAGYIDAIGVGSIGLEFSTAGSGYSLASASGTASLVFDTTSDAYAFASASGTSTFILDTDGDAYALSSGVGEISFTLDVTGESYVLTYGSGVTGIVFSVTGEGRTLVSASGIEGIAFTTTGEGYVQASTSGSEGLELAVTGEGYVFTQASGELIFVLDVNGEGRAPVGSSGEIGVVFTTSGEAYALSFASGTTSLLFSTYGEAQAGDGSSGKARLRFSTEGDAYTRTSGAGEVGLFFNITGKGYRLSLGAGEVQLLFSSTSNESISEASGEAQLLFATIGEGYTLSRGLGTTGIEFSSIGYGSDLGPLTRLIGPKFSRIGRHKGLIG